MTLDPLPLERDAVELFVQRARAQQADFALGPGNRAAVGEIVRLLDGLPLAIELAAARARVLSPAQLVERLRDRFRLLAGARGAAARQATLRAAIDWSWDLLAPWEQAAFAQCSVFERGFTLAAAESVLELTAWPEAPQTIDAMQALVDKSLLRSWIPAEPARYDIEEPCFGMYLSLHEYAAEKLVASGRERTVTCSSGTSATSRVSAATRRSNPCIDMAASGGAVRSPSSSTTWSPPAAVLRGAGMATRRSPPSAQPGRCWNCRARTRSARRWASRCWRSTA